MGIVRWIASRIADLVLGKPDIEDNFIPLTVRNRGIDE